MDTTLTVPILLGLIALIASGLFRQLFPFLVVLVLGMEYFSPKAAQGIYTIPRVGFLALVLTQILADRLRLPSLRRGLFVPLLVLSAYSWLSCLWSINPTEAEVRSMTLLFLLLEFVVIRGFIRSRHDVFLFWQALVLYAVVSTIVLQYQLATGSRVYESAIEEFGTRAGGLGVNPNEGAYYLSLGLLIVCSIGFLPRIAPALLQNIWARLLIGAWICLGILGTGSRTGVAALLVGGLFLLRPAVSTRWVSKPFLRQILGFAVVLGVLFLFLPALFWQLNARVRASGEDQLNGRLEIWSALSGHILAKPFVGYGLSSSKVVLSGSHLRSNALVAHNTVLTILTEGGIVALLLFCWGVLRALGILHRLRQHAAKEWRICGVILTALTVLAAVTSLAGDMQFNKLLWVGLALLDACGWMALTSPFRRQGNQPPQHPSNAAVDELPFGARTMALATLPASRQNV
jgi:O-antigen ligase